MALAALSDGDLLVAAQDPWLGRLRADGTAAWVRGSPIADFRGQRGTFSVSSDGTRVGFGFTYGKLSARFDLGARSLTVRPSHLAARRARCAACLRHRRASKEPASCRRDHDPGHDSQMATPRQDGLPIEGWINEAHPTLGGRLLPLQHYERSRSLAIHPAGDRLVLGTDWSLRAFDAKGTPLWARPAPGTVWAVNITGDGRLVLAAYSDGTIRWHRMSDGVELLAFMPLPDKTNWVAWSPEGFYAATPGFHGILRWHVNHGWDAPADAIPIEDIPGSFRPAMLPLVLQELETPRALLAPWSMAPSMCCPTTPMPVMRSASRPQHSRSMRSRAS
jgi:hypothetical protein